jgi:hypothetical protein
MLAAAAAALGPVGASYLVAYGSAQGNNLAAALQVGRAYGGIGEAVQVASASFVTRDV